MVNRFLVFLNFLLLPVFATAEVTYSAPAGFELKIEALVMGTPTTAYNQFLEVGEWWNAEHTWFGRAQGLSIEPEAGGCFCEHSGEKSALHMIVSHVDPGKAVHMVGGLGPLQGLGLHGAMSWTFEAAGEGVTRVTHVYRVTGYHPDGLEPLAPVVDYVQGLQVAGLVRKLGPAPGSDEPAS